MNEIIRSLFERKSVRVYEDREIPAEVKNAILRTAIEAPTAGNMTLYTVLDITDQALKDRLAVTCDNQPFIAKAPLVLVFCADYYRWYQLFRRHMDVVRTPGEGDLLLATADAVIAAQNAVVAAESFGIGSCYIGDIIENFEIHRELLNLPQHVVPACMVCLGYPTEQQKSRQKPTRFEVADIVHTDRYDIDKADQMERMLLVRNECKNEEELHGFVERFCKRKWNCEFSEEMTRSAKEIIKDFCK